MILHPCLDTAVLCFALILPVTGQELRRSVDLQHEFSNQPAPCYKNGYLIARDADRNTVRAFDASGQKAFEVEVKLPQAKFVSVRDAAVSPEGQLVVTAMAMNIGKPAGDVIAWLDKSGKTVRVIRTSPFTAWRIIFAGDGTLWAAGREYDDQQRDVQGHGVLRQFDKEGRPLKSILPVDSFPPSERHPAREAILAVNGGTVGLFSQSASEWVEVDSAKGEVRSRTRFAPLPRGALLMGAGITSNGDAWIGVFASESMVYRVDKANARLVREPQTGRDAVLLSADNRDLIFFRKFPRGLDWVSLPE